jgi:hypothetical protein
MSMRRWATISTLVLAVSLAVPAMAQAASYRYWSYWLGSEAGWTFASVGPAFRVPADGTVEGWSFAITGVTGNQPPGFAANFNSICSGTAAEDGRKRVAVVVDPGTSTDAPDGQQVPGAWALCVVAEQRATGYDVLRAATSVRTERGLICGIGGYPAQGCAEVVADDKAPATPTPRPTPKPTKPKPSPAASTATSAPTSAVVSPGGASPAAGGSQPAASVDVTRGDATSPATANPTTPSPATSSATSSMASPQSPSPTPSLSVLTAPLTPPPSDGGGGVGALAAGLAVVGIAGLGGAAILRMRRAT